MKKLNYCRVFTQKLRENGVLGIFCEKASEELLSLLYNKKDTWDVVTDMRTTRDRICEIALDCEVDGEKRVMDAFELTNTIWETVETK